MVNFVCNRVGKGENVCYQMFSNVLYPTEKKNKPQSLNLDKATLFFLSGKEMKWQGWSVKCVCVCVCVGGGGMAVRHRGEVASKI